MQSNFVSYLDFCLPAHCSCSRVKVCSPDNFHHLKLFSGVFSSFSLVPRTSVHRPGGQMSRSAWTGRRCLRAWWPAPSTSTHLTTLMPTSLRYCTLSMNQICKFLNWSSALVPETISDLWLCTMCINMKKKNIAVSKFLGHKSLMRQNWIWKLLVNILLVFS